MPISSSRQSAGAGGWSRGAQTGGANLQFRINWDDQQLWELINVLNRDGPTELNKILGELLEAKCQEVKKIIKDMAGPLKNIVVPPWGGSGQSPNIYTKVADSLNVFQVPGTSFHRLQSGASKSEYIDGIIGSRGGQLAKIVAGGMKSFPYPENLPRMVRSSTTHYARTGMAGDYSAGMMLKRKHPGFKRTMDYTVWVEEEMKKDWRQHAFNAIIDIAYGRR
tara:strand:- start:36488 stop:37153 length:666 start_codon:yes stop_codon:yes gene_type:complete